MKWLLFILCGFFPFGYSDARGEEWKFFSESEGSSFLFDAESVSFLSENVVRVWVKVVVSEKDRSAWVAKGGEKYLNLRYIKSSLEIDCKEKLERSSSLELLSEQDILDSFKGGGHPNGVLSFQDQIGIISIERYANRGQGKRSEFPAKGSHWESGDTSLIS